ILVQLLAKSGVYGDGRPMVSQLWELKGSGERSTCSVDPPSIHMRHAHWSVIAMAGPVPGATARVERITGLDHISAPVNGSSVAAPRTMLDCVAYATARMLSLLQRTGADVGVGYRGRSCFTAPPFMSPPNVGSKTRPSHTVGGANLAKYPTSPGWLDH